MPYDIINYNDVTFTSCSQSNVLLLRIIFSCILLSAFCFFQLVLETRRQFEIGLILYK